MKGRPRLLPLLAIFLVQAVYLLVCLAFAASYPAPPRLVAEDLLALPGGEVELAVRMVGVPASRLSRYRGGEVSFVLDPALSGDGANDPESLDAALDAEGRAVIGWEAPEKAGAYVFRAALPSEDVSVPLEARLTVWVVPSDRTLVLTSLDPVRLPAGREGEPGPDTSARSLLDSLADGRIIVYLQVGNPSGIDESRRRRWSGFPRGPVVGVAVPRGSGEVGEMLSLERYLKEHITGSWKRVEWAITTEVPHLRAFARAGLRALLVHPASRPLEIDNRAVFRASDWGEAREIVETHTEKGP